MDEFAEFHSAIPRRYQANGQYVRGRWVPGTVAQDTITGSVDPLNSKEAAALNIGRTGLGKVKVFTEDLLAIAEEGGGTPGDLIQWQGRWYEILLDAGWSNGIIPHHEYIGEYRADGKVVPVTPEGD